LPESPKIAKKSKLKAMDGYIAQHPYNVWLDEVTLNAW